MDFSSDDSLDDPNCAPDASGDSTSEYDSADEEPLARWRIHHSTNRPSSTGSTQNFSEDEIVRQQVANIDWGIPKDHMPNEDFSGVAVMKDIHQGIIADGTPLDYFEVFLTFDIVQTIVDQTNHYACQHLTAGNIDVGPQSRLQTEGRRNNSEGNDRRKDKRVVTTLSTVHSAKKMTAVKTKRGQVIFKPDSVVDYNTGKSSIDVSDQMASYASALRRCTKWYRKLAIEFIWGTSLVNAYFLYNECSRNKKITITEFREKVIEGMIDKFVDQSPGNQPPSISREAAGSSRGAAGSNKETIGSSNKHLLVNFLVGRPPKLKRGRCKGCYAIYGKKGLEVGGKRKRNLQNEQNPGVETLYDLDAVAVINVVQQNQSETESLINDSSRQQGSEEKTF
ncbi:unnamed protein product [Parnassius mnemosyne]|uniref:PiggyBac transposable element-derived protein domain-containing protein n=1 Tax=Parnassius mnemosyne TaxID=213953 RepID=A0AAV1LD77_9NEOP